MIAEVEDTILKYKSAKKFCDNNGMTFFVINENGFNEILTDEKFN